MPFQVQDKCYPDGASALAAVAEQYPTLPDSTGAVWYVRDLSIDANGLVLGNLYKSTSWTSTPIMNLTLQPCTIDSAARIFDKYSMQDIAFAVSLVIVLLIGFINGRHTRIF